MYAVIAEKPKDFTGIVFETTPTPVYLDDRLEYAKKYAQILRSKGTYGVKLVKVNKEFNEMLSQRKQETGYVSLVGYLACFQMHYCFNGQYFPDEQSQKYEQWSINEACKNNPKLAGLFN